MDIFDFAKEIETQGRTLYADLSGKIGVKELSAIFNFLAQEEQRHFDFFDAMQKKSAVPPIPEGTVLGQAKEAFAKMAEHFKVHHFLPPIDYEQAYQMALTYENNSIAHYEQALPGFGDERQLSSMKLIIDQEKAHARFIGSLMEFNRHPGEWLENAEFFHTEEY
jgi:rubrerythrin